MDLTTSKWESYLVDAAIAIHYWAIKSGGVFYERPEEWAERHEIDSSAPAEPVTFKLTPQLLQKGAEQVAKAVEEGTLPYVWKNLVEEMKNDDMDLDDDDLDIIVQYAVFGEPIYG